MGSLYLDRAARGKYVFDDEKKELGSSAVFCFYFGCCFWLVPGRKCDCGPVLQPWAAVKSVGAHRAQSHRKKTHKSTASPCFVFFSALLFLSFELANQCSQSNMRPAATTQSGVDPAWVLGSWVGVVFVSGCCGLFGAWGFGAACLQFVCLVVNGCGA